jgi:hypothetical protein
VVTYLLAVEFSSVGVPGLNSFSEDGVKGFEEGAVEVECPDGGADDEFHLEWWE